MTTPHTPTPNFHAIVKAEMQHTGLQWTLSTMADVAKELATSDTEDLGAFWREAAAKLAELAADTESFG